MKRFLMAVLAMVLSAGIVGATSMYGTVKVGKTTKVAGRNYVDYVTLSNPCTDYAGYDFYTSTDYAGLGSRKILIQSVIVADRTTQSFPVNENYALPFFVCISTVGRAGVAIDNGLDHSLKIKYNAIQ